MTGESANHLAVKNAVSRRLSATQRLSKADDVVVLYRTPSAPSNFQQSSSKAPFVVGTEVSITYLLDFWKAASLQC